MKNSTQQSASSIQEWRRTLHAQCSRLDAGFTLVEVLVALVILVSAVAILAQGFMAGGGASVTAQNRTKAAFLAATKIAELETGILPANLSQNGRYEDLRDWTWEVRSAPSTTLDVYEVTVTVTWKERHQERTLHLVRLLRSRDS